MKTAEEIIKPYTVTAGKKNEYEFICVTNAIKAMESYASERLRDEPKPSDEDIENASMDYTNEMSFSELATISARTAYKQGAFDMRDNNIYISPKS